MKQKQQHKIMNYNQLKSLKFKIPENKDRSLDYDKAKEYLLCLEKDLEYFEYKNLILEKVWEILDKTIYINYNTFWTSLLTSFKKFQEYIGKSKFYVIVDGNKIGSELWIYSGILEHIKNTPGYCGTILTTSIPDDFNPKIKNFVVFDDCIYSGAHIYRNIFGMLKKQLIKIGKWINNYYNTIIVVPYYSRDGKCSIYDALYDMNFNYSIHCGIRKIDPIVISDELFPDFEYWFWGEFEFENSLLYPIYFDHKVAGTASSFPNIYLNGKVLWGNSYGSLLKHNPNRECIDNILI